MGGGGSREGGGRGQVHVLWERKENVGEQRLFVGQRLQAIFRLYIVTPPSGAVLGWRTRMCLAKSR